MNLSQNNENHSFTQDSNQPKWILLKQNSFVFKMNFFNIRYWNLEKPCKYTVNN